MRPIQITDVRVVPGDSVSPIYPIDAFRLNTSIMIGQAERELLQKNAEAE